MKFDLHVHTVYSAVPGFPFLRDSFNQFDDIVRVARKKGIDGIGVTDHNTIEGSLKFKEYLKRKRLNLQVIVGEEIRTLSGDVIALDIDERISHKMTVEETLDMIRDSNGFSVAPHPYTRQGVGERAVIDHKFNLIETMNSCCHPNKNHKAKMLAIRLDIPEVGGSDSHRPEVIGNGITQVPDDEPVHESLEKGRTRVYGRTTPYFNAFQKTFLRLKNPQHIFCNPFR